MSIALKTSSPCIFTLLACLTTSDSLHICCNKSQLSEPKLMSSAELSTQTVRILILLTKDFHKEKKVLFRRFPRLLNISRCSIFTSIHIPSFPFSSIYDVHEFYYKAASLYEHLVMQTIILERWNCIFSLTISPLILIMCKRGRDRSGCVCEEARIVHSLHTHDLLHVHFALVNCMYTQWCRTWSGQVC